MTKTREKNQTSLFFVVYKLNTLWTKTDIDRQLDIFPHRRLSWLRFLQIETYLIYFTSSAYHTSDAGSQTGGQGHLTPSLTPSPSNPPSPSHTHNNNCSFMKAHFLRFQQERDRPINEPTDNPTDRQSLL